VQVDAAMSEKSETVANADGTLTARVSVVPQRVSRGGAWVAPDATLRVNADGSVSTVATSVDVHLSGGGAGALLSVGRGAGRLVLSWPGILPVPALAADTATYADVLPGVDLVLRARVESVSEVLVVKNRAAAANPALTTLRFGVSAENLSSSMDHGSVVWSDPSGSVVFDAATPLMWDSSVQAPSPSSANAEITEAPSGLLAPESSGNRAEMPVSLTGGQLVFTPDQAMLTSAETVYPVMIDPSVGKTNWAMINSTFVNQCYVMCNGYDSGQHMKVGWTNTLQGQQYRSLVDFGSASFAGKHVLSAKLVSYLLHSWNESTGSCTTSTTNVHQVGGFGSWSTWGNHLPTWGGVLAGVANQNCADAADVRSEWASPALTGYIQSVANANWVAYLGLENAGSAGSMGWKKFDEWRTTLEVTYNSVPTVPTGLVSRNDPATTTQACGRDAGSAFVRSSTPTLSAKPNDPDTETDLKVVFTAEKWNTTVKAWQPLGTPAVVTNLNNVTDVAQYTIPASFGLLDGDAMRWKAQTRDPWSWGGGSGEDASGDSAWCEVRVDTRAPTAPGVSSSMYGEYVPGVHETYDGAVGRTGDFMFGPGGQSDVAGYLWGWADPPNNYVPAPAVGASATVRLTPPPPNSGAPTVAGTLTLYVQGVDRTGFRDGGRKAYIMRVGTASDPVRVWTMAESGAATVLADTNQSGAGARDAGVHGLVLGAAGRVRGGATVATFGGSSWAETTPGGGRVVDAAKSFTVSAWVRPWAVARDQSVLSQDGPDGGGLGQNGPFNLQLTGDRWSWNAMSSGAAPSVENVVSPVAAQPGVWTNLVAVYDAGSSGTDPTQPAQLRLYVDGVLVDTEQLAGLWGAGGGLQFGRVLWGGAYLNYFAGVMGDVVVWDRVVSAAELAPLAATRVGRWRFDGDASDVAGFNRSLIGTGPVTYVAGHAGQAVHLTGSGALSTADVPLNTGYSYTVSAYVRPTSVSGTGAVLSQCGAVRCAFSLRYTSAGWAVVQAGADQAAAPSYTTAAAGVVALNAWTHLVVVYDAGCAETRLYVNGQRARTTTGLPALWQADTVWRVGRDEAGNFVSGDVDDVQVFQGVLPDTEVLKLYQP
jgi:hypothetical protein